MPCRLTSCMKAVRTVPTENREYTYSRNKEPLLSQLCSQQRFSLREKVRKQSFAKRSEPMSSSVSLRVDFGSVNG